jgi:hypothetical protein
MYADATRSGSDTVIDDWRRRDPWRGTPHKLQTADTPRRFAGVLYLVSLCTCYADDTGAPMHQQDMAQD